MRQRERSCAGTCHTLQKSFPGYYKNISHHTGACYGLQPGLQLGVHDQGLKYSVGDDGDVRGRHRKFHVEVGVGMNYTREAPIWLGVRARAGVRG